MLIIMMYSNIYFQTTYDCNLKCAPCFQNSGPGKKHTTISLENFEKIIEHFPEDEIKLCLTGGEIFKDIDRLWKYLEIIKNKNEQMQNSLHKSLGIQTTNGQRKNIIETYIQTNGFWGAKNDSEIKGILEKLKGFGVDELDITSKDLYHLQEGFKHDYIYNIEEVNFYHKILSKIKIRGIPLKENIFPKGRGKNNFDKENFKKNWTYCEGSLRKKTISIVPNGNVYMCCYEMYQIPGNIIEEPLDEMIYRAKEDPILKILNDEGISGVAKLQGMKQSEIDAISKKHGNCGLCAKLNGLFD